MLQIVEKACTVEQDLSRGLIVVESDCEGPPFTQAFEELNSQDARRIAQGYAGKVGVASPHINGNVQGPYPVNAQGQSLEHVKDEKGNPLPPQHPSMKPMRYRIDVPVCRPLR
jgi:hypothetical protein